jgi:hypothetical protein
VSAITPDGGIYFVKTLAVICALFALLLVPSLAQAAAPSIPINSTNGTLNLNGALQLQNFQVVNNQVVAVGTLTGTVTDRAGRIIGSVVKTVTLPLLSSSNGTCQILHLELGPLDLNLLGLQVHLDKVVLDITAQAGGGLLGDLLCQISGLLGGVDLNNLVGLLNKLLGAL